MGPVWKIKNSKERKQLKKNVLKKHILEIIVKSISLHSFLRKLSGIIHIYIYIYIYVCMYACTWLQLSRSVLVLMKYPLVSHNLYLNCNHSQETEFYVYFMKWNDDSRMARNSKPVYDTSVRHITRKRKRRTTYEIIRQSSINRLPVTLSMS